MKGTFLSQSCPLPLKVTYYHNVYVYWKRKGRPDLNLPCLKRCFLSKCTRRKIDIPNIISITLMLNHVIESKKHTFYAKTTMHPQVQNHIPRGKIALFPFYHCPDMMQAGSFSLLQIYSRRYEIISRRITSSRHRQRITGWLASDCSDYFHKSLDLSSIPLPQISLVPRTILHPLPLIE